MSEWKTVKRGKDVNGREIELRYAEFGKGKARVRSWNIFRDGDKVGYASVPDDAEVNFQRAMNGLTRNPETGQWE